jgi:hypothetical protein
VKKATTELNRGQVRRETGKEQVVQVHYDEGVAIHIGPEPCVARSRGVGRGTYRPAISKIGDRPLECTPKMRHENWGQVL